MVVVGDKEGGLGASHIYYRRPSHRPVVFRGSNGWEGGQIFLLILPKSDGSDGLRSGRVLTSFIHL